MERTEFETTGPVQVITAADLQASGSTTVSDVFRNVSANGAAGTLSGSFNNAFAGGGARVATRSYRPHHAQLCSTAPHDGLATS